MNSETLQLLHFYKRILNLNKVLLIINYMTDYINCNTTQPIKLVLNKAFSLVQNFIILNNLKECKNKG